MNVGRFALRWVCCLFLGLLAFPGMASTGRAQPVEETAEVISPDGKTLLRVYGGRLSYSVEVGGKPVLLRSPLGFRLSKTGEIGRDVQIVSVRTHDIDETWVPIAWTRKVAIDHAKETTIRLREKSGWEYDLVIRAYDEGVAFRYSFPEQTAPALKEMKDLLIRDEVTAFRFPGNPPAWYPVYPKEENSFEGKLPKRPLGEIKPGNFVGLPVLVKVRDDQYAVVAEADVNDWAGLFVTGAEKSGEGTSIVARLARRGDDEVAVKTSVPCQSPWRVIMLASDPGLLIGSPLILNLNPPCAISDPGWIHPGLASWNWWSGDLPTTETLKKYIQFSADMGWPYALIDSGWYGKPNTPESDITKVDPAVDMAELRRFAAERKVRLWLWMHWADVDRNEAYKKAFPLFHEWDIAGVKIDFMDRQDQAMVNWYHAIMEATAHEHLMLDLHGAYKPTGLSRTWPHFLTQEGVMGAEYNKWSANITPAHDVTLPYTRMLVGPMDYTAGGFRNRTVAAFKPKNDLPEVMGTRAHELAKFVIYESPLGVVADKPEAMKDQPGLDFLKIVPTTWEDVKFLGGAVGESIVLARKNKRDWFVGGMTNEAAREVKIPTAFLEAGKKYTATLWRDADDAATEPEHLTQETKEITGGDEITVKMAPAGGFALQIKPE